MGDKIKVGIIGLGKMGLIRYEQLMLHPEVELVCGSDPDKGRFSLFPAMTCSTDPMTVTQSDVDAVFVATPNRETPIFICQALDTGKHVFSEKPPGRTLEDIHAIREAEARNSGLKVKFGFNHRYHAGIQEAKRIVDSGRLGRMLWMRGIYGKCGGEGFEKTWRSDKDAAGGGILLDQGIHMLDLFRLFGGNFVEIKSMVTTAYWNIDVEDNAFALLRDEQGRVSMLHSSSTQWQHRFTLEIYLSDGYLSVNGILSSSRSYGDETISVARRKFDDGFNTGSPQEEIIYFDTDPSWELETADFIDNIRHDTPVNPGSTLDALNVMEAVFQIYANDETFHHLPISK